MTLIGSILNDYMQIICILFIIRVESSTEYDDNYDATNTTSTDTFSTFDGQYIEYLSNVTDQTDVEYTSQTTDEQRTYVDSMVTYNVSNEQTNLVMYHFNSTYESI
jgi:hypothetical protein